MKLKVGISNRHVHLNKEDYAILFKDEPLGKVRDLTQPLEFASDKFVTIKTNKNEINNVRVIGPLRSYTQVEISKTDSYFLGIDPPIRESGNLEGSKEVTIETSTGKVTKECAIIATRHIHVSKEDASRFTKDKYKILINSKKGGILYDVSSKVGNYTTELHLDTDDANAFLLTNGDEVEVIEE